MDIKTRTEALLREYREAQGEATLKEIGKRYGDWFKSQYAIEVNTTPRGGKALKHEAKLWLWAAQFRIHNGGYEQLVKDWEAFKPHVDDFERVFGSVQILGTLQTAYATYNNLRGLPTKTFKSLVKKIDTLLASLTGWRKKALKGNLNIALAGPDDFRGTSGGKYKSQKDTLYVRATPSVMKRMGGTYGSIGYILIHELGHRYEHKNSLPRDFQQPEWTTTKYSKVEGFLSEAFAELFALGHFGITSLRGADFRDTLDRFEALMSGKTKVATRPIPLDKSYIKSYATKAAKDILQECRSHAPKRGSWSLKKLRAFNNGKGLMITLDPFRLDKILRKGKGFVPNDRPLSVTVQSDNDKTPRGARKVVLKAAFASWSKGLGWIEIHLFGGVPSAHIEAHNPGKEIYSVLIHELTHAVELLDQDPGSSTRGLSREEHSNHPLEVRAYMQQIADEISQFPELHMRAALTHSPTWQTISPYLTEKNRRAIIQGVSRTRLARLLQ